MKAFLFSTLMFFGMSSVVVAQRIPENQKPNESQVQFKVSSIGSLNIKRGFIGIYTQKTDSTEGSYTVLVSVEPGSPAQRAGMVAGDTILSFNGVSARGSGFDRLGSFIVPKNKITFKLARNGIRELSMEVGIRPANMIVLNQNGDSVDIHFDFAELIIPLIMERLTFQFGDSSGMLRFAGADAVTLTKDLSTSLKLNMTGVLIVGVKANTPAQAGGLKSGDVIMKVGSVKVSNVQQLKSAALKDSIKTVRLEISRNGKIEAKTIRLASAK